MSDSLCVKSLFRNYDVNFIGDFTLPLQGLVDQHAFFIIDAHVWRIFADRINKMIPETRLLIVEANENNKSLDKCRDIIETLVDSQIRRNEQLVAIGGGIIQDVTAFSASILYRGIEWSFFPTTLLSQADSCIGSKTSINIFDKKNLVGNFYLPSNIYIDSIFLNSLSIDDIRSGIGEMLHFYFFAESPYFDSIISKWPDLLVNRTLLIPYICESLRVKKIVVEMDEFDRGERNKFNYGHTFGHALESLTSYRIKHGQAVIVGMDLANYISFCLGFMDQDSYNRFHKLLKNIFPSYSWGSVDIDSYINYLNKDKKNIGMDLVCILSKGFGRLTKEKIPMDKRLKGLIRSYFEELRMSENLE